MKRSWTISLLAVSALAASEHASRADAPDASASARPPPPFDAEPIPTEKSPPPKPEEWRAATVVALSRDAPGCRAYRVREWIKVVCDAVPPWGIGQLTGPPDGVQISVAAPKGFNDPTAAPMQVIFPLRLGTGHVFQTARREYNPISGTQVPQSWVVITDHWVTGEAPIITAD